MNFHSILFDKNENNVINETVKVPAYFVDLNLNQVIDTITASKQEYNLKPYFYIPLHDINTIKYRHAIMQDLENHILFEYIKSFASKMHTMREHLAQSDKFFNKYQRDSWFLDAVEIYCECVISLAHDLARVDLKSYGLLAFRNYISNYIRSDYFSSLLEESKKLKAELLAVKYCIHIKGNIIKVYKYNSEIDYSAEVERIFEKFKNGEAKDYRVKLPTYPGMNHVEEDIINHVARLFSDAFTNIDEFYTKNGNYINDTISIFDRQIQFYIAYLEYAEIFKQRGLKFCYPVITDTCKEIHSYEAYDLALAHKLINQKTPIVCNDFYIKDNERIFVVSGPNQGGKTTFARTFGQLHYLASLGCPVAGNESMLFLFDQIFTHFEKEENTKNLSGKLQDDLIRVYNILSQATSNSIVIMNEIFTSTTLIDATFLGEKIIKKMIELDLLCVYVTFIDELSLLSEKTVSLVSTVVPEDSASRTYKIVRKPADGLSFAISIAEKYRLTYDCLKERVKL